MKDYIKKIRTILKKIEDAEFERSMENSRRNNDRINTYHYKLNSYPNNAIAWVEYRDNAYKKTNWTVENTGRLIINTSFYIKDFDMDGYIPTDKEELFKFFDKKVNYEIGLEMKKKEARKIYKKFQHMERRSTRSKETLRKELLEARIEWVKTGMGR